MKTIFFFFWNLIMGIKRAKIKPIDKETASPVLILSLDAYRAKKQTAAALPNWRKQHANKVRPKLRPLTLIQKEPQNNPRAEWNFLYDRNKMFRSSA